MISLRKLSMAAGAFFLEEIDLEVAGGEIYFLVNRLEQGSGLLFRVLNGTLPPQSGEFRFDNLPAAERQAAFIDRIPDVGEFETEARIGDWIDFLCSGCRLDRASIFKTLLVLNFHEAHLKKRVRDLPPEVFQQVYLAVCLAPGRGNIVVHDFIRGAAKGFELKFNKLLLQQKEQGRAILSLGSDIFNASEIADRVGFVKGGRLLFEADAADLKEMDLKDLYVKFLN